MIKKNDRVHQLSARDLSIIKRIRNNNSASVMYENPYLPTDDGVFDITTSGIQSKKAFIINKEEHKKIINNVYKIRQGKLKVDKYGEKKNYQIKKKNYKK